MDEFHEIEALKRGDGQAFAVLVDTFSQRIFNLTFSILKNKEDAADATQETFTSVYLSISDFKRESSLSTWVYRIAVNKCHEVIRKKNRVKRSGQTIEISQVDFAKKNALPQPFFHPGVELERKEKALILSAALDALPENQRTAFILHKVEGFSYLEITDIMGLSLSAVESLIFRGRQNLRKLLENYFKDEI